MPHRVRAAILALAGIACFAGGMAIDYRLRLSGWRQDVVLWGSLAIYAVLLYRASRREGRSERKRESAR